MPLNLAGKIKLRFLQKSNLLNLLNMSLISLNKVSLRYGAHVLLDEADLNIAQSDALALVGKTAAARRAS